MEDVMEDAEGKHGLQDEDAEDVCLSKSSISVEDGEYPHASWPSLGEQTMSSHVACLCAGWPPATSRCGGKDWDTHTPFSS